MAHATDFPGSNKVFKAPPGREDVSDLHTFVNGKVIISAWKPTPEELEEINRTGLIFLSSFSGMTLFPVFVGSESEVRKVAADYGPIWNRGQKLATTEDGDPAWWLPCTAPGCTRSGWEWPTIRLPREGMDEDANPARLEIPRVMCPAHQRAFQPRVFLTCESRMAIEDMMAAWGFPRPDYNRLSVRWRSIEDPVFAEFDGTEARMCAPEQ